MAIRIIPRCMILVFTGFLLLSAQTFKTVMLDFTRTVHRADKEDASSGTIYYDGSKTILKITAPLKQQMFLTDTSFFIYYPDEQRLLEIKSGPPASLPFFNLFTGALKETFGLPELGYTIQKNEIKQDTLFTCWIPPKHDRHSKGMIIIALVDDKIVISESKNPDGGTAVKAIFENHAMFQSTFFPMKITLVNYMDAVPITEIINFSNLLFNEPIPADLYGFTAPEGIVREKLEW